MGVEGDNYSPEPKVDEEKVGRAEEEDVVEKETKLRTNLEKELGVRGAVVAICIYLTKDFAPMVSADHIRRTLKRKGMTVVEVETILRDAKFRRVLAWELDEECGRLAENLARAGEDDRQIRSDALEGRKAKAEMQSFAIKEGFSVWARPEGEEAQVVWNINNKSLSVEEISALAREHEEYEDDNTPQIRWF